MKRLLLLALAACGDPVIDVPVSEGARVEVCPSVVALSSGATSGTFSVTWTGDDPIFDVVWVPVVNSTLDVQLTSAVPTGGEGTLDFQYTYDVGTDATASGRIRIRHETFPPFGLRVEVDPEVPAPDCSL